MNTYHKIQTIYKRDPDNKNKTLLIGQYSLPEFEYLKNNKWIWTEKIDGTNIRIIWDGGNYEIKGKTDNAQTPTFLLDSIRAIIDKQKMKEVFYDDSTNPMDVCLYGEGYGAKIQKGGGKYRDDNGFILFDVKVDDWWLKREDVEDVAEKLNLEVAPIIGDGTLDEMVEFVKNGFNSQWGDFIAEGVVARPEVELKARDGKRIITKLKYKDFLR